MWVCGPFCHSFPIPEIKDPIDEMREFALFSAKLSENKDALPRLLSALQTGDPKTFEALVTEFKAERYCLQLCHWLCYEICSRWCFVICIPNIGGFTEFYKIGQYAFRTEVNSALNGNGLTNVQNSGGTNVANYAGNANSAFFETLRLNGALSKTLNGQPLEYCFEYVQTDQNGNLPNGKPVREDSSYAPKCQLVQSRMHRHRLAPVKRQQEITFQ